MASNEYHFISTWRVPGTAEEVYAIIGDPPGLVRWWPSVYLAVEEIEPDTGQPAGQGPIFSLYTKGWLPYTLRWQFRVREARPPVHISLQAWGDFEGRGIWTFRQDGAWVDITYDWKIRADKPLLRYGSFLFKPIFAANHRWAMQQGEQSLKLELARRHAATPEERDSIPPPPPPATSAPLLAAAVLLLAAIAAFVWSLSKRKRSG